VQQVFLAVERVVVGPRTRRDDAADPTVAVGVEGALEYAFSAR
jgi:hypothetical protein